MCAKLFYIVVCKYARVCFLTFSTYSFLGHVDFLFEIKIVFVGYISATKD